MPKKKRVVRRTVRKKPVRRRVSSLRKRPVYYDVLARKKYVIIKGKNQEV